MAAQELQIQLKKMNYLIDKNLEVKSSKKEKKEVGLCSPLSNLMTPLLRYKTAFFFLFPTRERETSC